MKITANILSGPWPEPFAEASFQSIQGLVDEIIVVDTSPGSNPNAEINKKYATKILEFPGGGTKDFSFSAARELARNNTETEWLLRLDSDEILHEDDIIKLKEAVEWANKFNFSAIGVSFYHFMVYPYLYQYIEPKAILFKTKDMSWHNGVHELPSIRGKTYWIDVKYFHMGYCRGQAEVLKRWKLYTDIDGKPDYYLGRDPNNILTDRLSVCQKYTGTYPKVLYPVLDKLFPDWQEKKNKV